MHLSPNVAFEVVAVRCFLAMISTSRELFYILGLLSSYSGHCQATVSAPAPYCPDSHPYPYLNGTYCCDGNKESLDTNFGDKCDGGALLFDSACCDGQNTQCPHSETCMGVRDCYSDNMAGGGTMNVAPIVKVSGAAECQLLCQRNPDCNFFLHNKWNKNCKLKGTVNPMPNNEQILGPKFCPAPCFFPGKGAGGKANVKFFLGVANATACQLLCQQHDDCFYFVYVEHNRRCKLKPQLSSDHVTDNARNILGPKFCPGDEPNPTPTPPDTCPEDHPYPYLEGMYCCMSSREKTNPSEGELCDGSKINFISTCCEDDMFTKCPHDQCKVINPSAGQCPPNHPYPYLNGDFCCMTMTEKVNAADGASCDGGTLSLTSSCCLDDQYVPCPGGAGVCWVVNTDEVVSTMAPTLSTMPTPPPTGPPPSSDPPTSPSTPMDPMNGCPVTHPFPYFDGKYCCQFGVEKVDPFHKEACDGGPISLASRCCKDDAFVTCPLGAEKCGQEETCPVSHPFPYLQGKYCCEFQWEGINMSEGESCDGSILALNSTCCENNQFVLCPVDKCETINPDAVTIPVPPTSPSPTPTMAPLDGCPSTHPFAYFQGKYCCRNKVEKTVDPPEEGCNGSALTIDSTCCKDDNFVKCPMDTPCRLTNCTDEYPYPYFNGDFCCQSDREKVDPLDGEACDGSIISLSSVCCKGDQFIDCPNGKGNC